MACLSYLSFRCFDSDITDDEVDEFVARGEYVLHQYSLSNFLHHIRGAWRDAGDANEIPNVSTSIREFLKARWNPSFRHANSEQSPSFSRLRNIQLMDARDYEKLNIIAAYLRSYNLAKNAKGLFLRCTRVADSQIVCSSSHKQTWTKSRCFWQPSLVVLQNVSTYWP